MQTWHEKVQTVYSSLEELEIFDEMYGVVSRCGFSSAKELWEVNPFIGGSSEPSDYGLARVEPGQLYGIFKDSFPVILVKEVLPDKIIGMVLLGGKEVHYIPETFFDYWHLS